jgi:hypothetical protein
MTPRANSLNKTNAKYNSWNRQLIPKTYHFKNAILSRGLLGSDAKYPIRIIGPSQLSACHIECCTIHGIEAQLGLYQRAHKFCLDESCALAFLLKRRRYEHSGFKPERVMTDNSPPSTPAPLPRTHGNADRFIESSILEGLTVRSSLPSAHRAEHLPRWLHRYTRVVISAFGRSTFSMGSAPGPGIANPGIMG